MALVIKNPPHVGKMKRRGFDPVGKTSGEWARQPPVFLLENPKEQEPHGAEVHRSQRESGTRRQLTENIGSIGHRTSLGFLPCAWAGFSSSTLPLMELGPSFLKWVSAPAVRAVWAQGLILVMRGVALAETDPGVLCITCNTIGVLVLFSVSQSLPYTLWAELSFFGKGCCSYLFQHFWCWEADTLLLHCCKQKCWPFFLDILKHIRQQWNES